MKAQVYSNLELIGDVALRIIDKSMGVVGGEFFPNALYFEKFQNIVRLFNEDRNWKLWDSLKINVQLENGFWFSPVGGIVIDDYAEFPDEKYINIVGNHWHVLQDFFETNPPRPFLEEPWQSVDIEKKIELEDKVRMVLKSFIKEGMPEEIKELNNAEINLVAAMNSFYQVLISVINPNCGYSYAFVNLKDTTELTNESKLEFYEDFDEFKFKSMYVDKQAYDR